MFRPIFPIAQRHIGLIAALLVFQCGLYLHAQAPSWKNLATRPR